jgi:hypothetical protein
MHTRTSRIRVLESALDEVCKLLQSQTLSDTERKNLVREGNSITAKLEELAA